jgi:hypothetical protein
MLLSGKNGVTHGKDLIFGERIGKSLAAANIAETENGKFGSELNGGSKGIKRSDH